MPIPTTPPLAAADAPATPDPARLATPTATADSSRLNVTPADSARPNVSAPDPNRVDVTAPDSNQVDVTAPDSGQVDIAISDPIRADVSASDPGQADVTVSDPGRADVTVSDPGRADVTASASASASERGYVTAETALLLPILLGIGYALALVVLLAADQIRCGDAAWEAARALARGVPAAQLSDIAARYAPAGAHASAWSDDGSLTVEIERDQSIASRFLPSIRISATATVPCEPRVDGCPIDSTDMHGRPNG